ncbi:MAG: nuclear transport factor 2 family protein [Novosphingobium sp.]
MRSRGRVVKPGYGQGAEAVPLKRMSDEDRTAVTDLIHRYALHIRSGEPGECAGLFTEDGAFEVRQRDPFDPASLETRSRVTGRDGVAGYVGASGGASLRMVPMIHNVLVELDGDQAKASSLMVGRQWPSTRETLGEYADSFRRVDGRWYFSERIYTIWRTPEA